MDKQTLDLVNHLKKNVWAQEKHQINIKRRVYMKETYIVQHFFKWKFNDQMIRYMLIENVHPLKTVRGTLVIN